MINTTSTTPQRFGRIWTLLLPTLLLLSLVSISQAHAEELANIIESSLDADEPVRIGDEVLYTVKIEHVPGLDLQIFPPDEGSRWREIDRQLTADESEDHIITEARLRYGIYRTGPTRGPPISATLVARESDDSAELELPQHAIDVVALTDENATLDGPRSPRPLWNDRPLLVIAGGGGLAICLLALIAFFVVRKRSLDGALDPSAPPEDIARHALTLLQSSDLLERQEYKIFYLSLSEIIRRYLGRRWNFPGTEWTTTEVMAKLHTIEHRDFRISADRIADWMHACDRVKFAGYTPTSTEAQHSLLEAFEILKATLPTPEPEPEEETT